MSAAAFGFISTPNSVSLSLTHLLPPNTSLIFFNSLSVPTYRNSCLSKSASLNQVLFLRVPYGSFNFKRHSFFTSSKPFSSPVMEWQDCTVRTEIDVPVSVAYNCYADREAIPRWMPFISSVKVSEDKPDLSQWSLKYKAFGRDIEYSWLARNLQPIPNQKIHWRSLEGLPNSMEFLRYPEIISKASSWTIRNHLLLLSS
ncbi:uncharacterized protein LOC116138079 isoform X2 [Pistacia vera]|uniref:uncharacterized protein LOC116138079 isoform X2 n=1 Tax=Pistacia vera TaxID=55513 RepID=UPI00126339E1|nr:uncharacterized protein LOC116138079 isoform X2 [Pistacia vera]